MPRVTRPKTGQPRYKYTAKNADKHTLYQLSVQNPDREINLISQIFKKRRKRHALSLREDFCGTALLCAYWVESKKGRTALGIDFDPQVLAWGIDNNLADIDEPGDRITLCEQDVLTPVKTKFDIAVGFNFSYWIFRRRGELVKYFKGVRKSLVKDGIFFLDAYGGPDAQALCQESRVVQGGFTYIWDQHSFNPIDNSVVNYIHFTFRDGSRMDRAFTYEWRFWSLTEIRELLFEAGFEKVTVYWECDDLDRFGNPIYRAKESVEQESAWLCCICAEK